MYEKIINFTFLVYNCIKHITTTRLCSGNKLVVFWYENVAFGQFQVQIQWPQLPYEFEAQCPFNKPQLKTMNMECKCQTRLKYVHACVVF